MISSVSEVQQLTLKLFPWKPTNQPLVNFNNVIPSLPAHPSSLSPPGWLTDWFDSAAVHGRTWQRRELKWNIPRYYNGGTMVPPPLHNKQPGEHHHPYSWVMHVQTGTNHSIWCTRKHCVKLPNKCQIIPIKLPIRFHGPTEPEESLREGMQLSTKWLKGRCSLCSWLFRELQKKSTHPKVSFWLPWFLKGIW